MPAEEGGKEKHGLNINVLTPGERANKVAPSRPYEKKGRKLCRRTNRPVKGDEKNRKKIKNDHRTAQTWSQESSFTDKGGRGLIKTGGGAGGRIKTLDKKIGRR